MDHMKVLKRAWEIVWSYRALWIFGIIVALTTASGGQGGGGGGGGAPAQYNFQGEDFAPGGEFPMPEVPPEVVGTLVVIIGGGVACVVVILIVASVVARYVAETALIQMVDDYEETGEKRSIRQGFRLGWSRTAWRLFLISLIVDLPAIVVFILLFLPPAGLIMLSVLAIEKISVAVGVIGIVAAVGLIFLIILLLIIVGAALSLLKQFFRRVCALEELGVVESIRQGFNVVKRHLWDVAIMWIIMIGLGIAWMLLMIPVTILLFVVGLMLAGPALLIGGLATLVGGPAMWILAAVIGIPIFILVLVVPGLFLGGLAEAFKSSVWTLTYRELRALENLDTEPEELPELDTPDLE